MIDCLMGTVPALAIIKLEKEEGVLAHQDVRKGKRTFDIKYIQNLMMAKKTRVLKVALFTKTEDGSSIEGIVCDRQRARSALGTVANFFLCNFLGCRPAEEPMIVTKTFFEAVKSYINERIDDLVKKAEVMTHLISELTSGRSSVQISGFLVDYIPEEHRDSLEHHLQARGISGNMIHKDTSLIEQHLKRIMYEFQSQIKVVGPKDALAEKTSMELLESGEVRFQITDQLKRVGG